MDERLNTLETKTAYNDRSIAELNAEVFRQGRQIAALEAQVRAVSSLLRELGIGADPSQHQKPPHY